MIGIDTLQNNWLYRYNHWFYYVDFQNTKYALVSHEPYHCWEVRKFIWQYANQDNCYNDLPSCGNCRKFTVFVYNSFWTLWWRSSKTICFKPFHKFWSIFFSVRHLDWPKHLLWQSDVWLFAWNLGRSINFLEILRCSWSMVFSCYFFDIQMLFTLLPDWMMMYCPCLSRYFSVYSSFYFVVLNIIWVITKVRDSKCSLA